MLYTSIDIETSGLNSEQDQVLSIGAIIEDTTKKLNFEEIPKFNAAILLHQITGSPRAITMNRYLIGYIGEYLESDKQGKERIEAFSGYQFLTPDDVAKEFYYFLWNNLEGPRSPGCERPKLDGNTKSILINVAGKNFGTFDKPFLEKLPWWKKLIQPRQRIIDPSVLFCNWNEDDALPSLTKCKERAGIKGAVLHDALADAWDVIEVLRKFY